MNNVYIQHAENKDEYSIPNTMYKVNGFCRNSKTVYEYYGCIYHGCIKCTKPYELNIYNNCTNKELYEKTIEREMLLKKHGHDVVSIWECDEYIK